MVSLSENGNYNQNLVFGLTRLRNDLYVVYCLFVGMPVSNMLSNLRIVEQKYRIYPFEICDINQKNVFESQYFDWNTNKIFLWVAG